jgi:hypothetical protein
MIPPPMSRAGRAIRDITIIVLGTLLAIELVSFAVLVRRTQSAEGLSLGAAVTKRLDQHPWRDKGVRELKHHSQYIYFPPTQHIFRTSIPFSTLRVGRHGFVPNGDADPADYPGKPPGLVRVVMLGGSTMAGATASANDKTIPARLEALLEEAGSTRVQVLNLGVGGNYSYGEVTQLINEVAYLAPDVIVMLDGYNDAQYVNLEYIRSELPAPVINFAEYSYQYFDTMAGLRGALRAPPPVMTYAFLLVADLRGVGIARSLKSEREALYEGLPAWALSRFVAARDPRFDSVLKTNLDFAAAWASRRQTWLFAYLQPHPWEFKDVSCERAKGIDMMMKRLGPTVSVERYASLMQAAFQGYAQVYRELAAAYADAPRVRFTDIRRLFENVDGCIYNDVIHYNDDGNLRIATRMRDDLLEAGAIPRR